MSITRKCWIRESPLFIFVLPLLLFSPRSRCKGNKNLFRFLLSSRLSCFRINFIFAIGFHFYNINGIILNIKFFFKASMLFYGIIRAFRGKSRDNQYLLLSYCFSFPFCYLFYLYSRFVDLKSHEPESNANHFNVNAHVPLSTPKVIARKRNEAN